MFRTKPFCEPHQPYQKRKMSLVNYIESTKRLTENELSDFRRLWHDGCGETIIEAQDVDRNHSPEV
jgi:hypothetical protein